MSDRPIDLDLTSSTAKTIDAAETAETRSQKKARLASVLSRGMVGDRLHVDLPPHLHGEWVPDDATEIYRKEAMGFRVDTEYAKNRALHSKGDSANRVGDVVFMVCDREDYELIQEIRREEYEKMHGKPGQGTKKEERDFASQAEDGGYVKPDIESREHIARKEDIRAAINSTQ